MRLTRRALATACLVTLVSTGAGPLRAAAPITVGEPKPVPPLALEDMQGRAVDLGRLAGKVVVLNLWATWCAPCREEMPALDRLQAAFAGQDVVVVALSLDRGGPERVQAFLDEIGVKHLTVYRDPKAASSRALKVPGLPATLLLDRQGREVGRVLGLAVWDGPEAKAAVQALLDRPAS